MPLPQGYKLDQPDKPPSLPKGYVLDKPPEPSMFSTPGTGAQLWEAVNTSAPQALHNLFQTGKRAETLRSSYDRGVGGLKDAARATLDTVGGKGTAASVEANLPPGAKYAGNGIYEVGGALMSMIDGLLTPLGAAAAAVLPGASNVVKAGVGAGFGAVQSPQTGEAVSAAVEDPNAETVPRAVVQTGVNLLPLAFRPRGVPPDLPRAPDGGGRFQAAVQGARSALPSTPLGVAVEVAAHAVSPRASTIGRLWQVGKAAAKAAAAAKSEPAADRTGPPAISDSARALIDNFRRQDAAETAAKRQVLTDRRSLYERERQALRAQAFPAVVGAPSQPVALPSGRVPGRPRPIEEPLTQAVGGSPEPQPMTVAQPVAAAAPAAPAPAQLRDELQANGYTEAQLVAEPPVNVPALQDALLKDTPRDKRGSATPGKKGKGGIADAAYATDKANAAENYQAQNSANQIDAVYGAIKAQNAVLKAAKKPQITLKLLSGSSPEVRAEIARGLGQNPLSENSWARMVERFVEDSKAGTVQRARRGARGVKPEAVPEVATEPVAPLVAETIEPAVPIRPIIDKLIKNGFVDDSGARTIEMMARRNSHSAREAIEIVKDALGESGKATGKSIADAYQKRYGTPEASAELRRLGERRMEVFDSPDWKPTPASEIDAMIAELRGKKK